MGSVLRLLHGAYRNYFFHSADQHSADWLLSSSPWYPALVVLAYVALVKVVLRRFMKGRPAYNLDRVIAVYNLVQIVVCFCFVYTGLALPWVSRFRLYCDGVDDQNNPHAPFIRKYIWSFYMLKVVDLVETVFFMLRRKESQVTFLHEYHHGGMVVVGYLGVRHVPSVHIIVQMVINCFVHVVMYAYYFATSMWPQYKKSIWWKKHITQLQLVQFVLVILQSIPPLTLQDCGYPAYMAVILIAQNIIFFTLFFNFYVNAYRNKANTS